MPLRATFRSLGIAAPLAIAMALLACAGGGPSETNAPADPYEPSWRSLRQHETPQWLRDAKFGIYTHWGPYAVPAVGPNGTWYSHDIYMEPDSDKRKHHEATYGPLTEFGYKEFIPMFTGEKFDPEEWADLFQKSGARFAGPVAEHHDGFAMWDTRYSDWNAAKMGPKRDIVGELEKSIKARGMKFVTAFHHAANWFFFPVWDKRYDCSDPQYSGLYGIIHEEGERPNEEFLIEWHGKLIEVIDKYDPDLIWFDFGLDLIQESYTKDFLAHYFNNAARSGKEVEVTYKDHDLPPGVGLVDLELGQEPELTHHEWITDTSVDDQGAWSFVTDAGFKPVDRLVDNLVDRIAKNGYLLLNVGPKPDGTIPDEAKQRLLGIGEWLEINGEAIFETTPWIVAGEGPTRLEKRGAFNEAEIKYTARDIRFTTKDDVLYAIALDWPDENILIKSIALHRQHVGLYETEIESVSMLGDGKELSWELTKEGLSVELPETKPCEHAFVFKIVRRRPF